MRFSETAWLTPNSYKTNFASLPQGPGIYLLVAGDLDTTKRRVSFCVAYVGMSKNIAKRIEGHPVLRTLYQDMERVRQLRQKYHSIVCPVVFVYFRQFKGDLARIERNLIRLFQPRYNVRDKEVSNAR